MNVPELRFPEFSGEWEEKKLGGIAEIVGGGTPNTDNFDYWNGDIDWYTPSEIGKNKYVKSSIRKINHVGLKKSSAKLLPAGTILLSSRATVGEMSIIQKESSTNQGFQSLIVKNENFNEFIYYLVHNFKNDLIKNASGSTFLEISKNEVKKIKINIPGFQEQIKIASFLSKVDEKIGKLEKKQELWETYKKGMMQKIFSQELRFKDENGEDYHDWEEKKLKTISECLDNNRNPLNSNDRLKMQGDIPYYGANGIVDYIDAYIFDEPLVLLAEDGGNFEEFQNRPIAQLITGKSWVNNHAHVLRNRSEITIEFLFYSLVHKDIRKYINGTSRSKLNKKDMLSIQLFVPSLLEQKKIVNTFSAVDTKINRINQEIILSKYFKKGLLQQMFC